jgi:hypothetical protein
MMKILINLLVLIPLVAVAQLEISTTKQNLKNYFPISTNGEATAVLIDDISNPLIGHSVRLFKEDVKMVTGATPEVLTDLPSKASKVILVGVVGQSEFIDQLIGSKKLKVDDIKGGWEQYIMQTVKSPFSGVDEALVIAGSDRRGAAFGVFSLAEAMGVSPWYWWADVPVETKDAVYVKKGRYVSSAPSVKYRGIFLNDEAPALRGWAQEKFGDFNHDFYVKLYELLLRLKANYLWPAMWRPSAFADDDPLNAKLADEYGIVINTTHHEPMMRAHDEWSRYGEGAWNYQTNKENLRKFWRGGIERMDDYESVVTVGMRGDGDEAMSESTAVDLMKEIISDQRDIIADVTGKPASETPQVWAIYKEIQDYYDKGMRVPEDITVLFCDDNWGNVRILPKQKDLDHEGGYGMYYHFDYVGGPVSYRWLNVTQIEKVWEQMNLTYDWGVKDLWIVNVGDLKPMELPISYFLDYAFNAETMKAADIPDYYIDWATQQFGEQHANEIAEILKLYTKYNARRTPEMLKPETYSLDNYREADRILAEYDELVTKSNTIYEQLDESKRSAFYQLVLSPVEMCANLNHMYVSAAKNKVYALQSRASANIYADQTREYFLKDAQLANEYHSINNGKWNHFMDQIHIGYTSWNNPPVNKMPEITYIQPRSTGNLGYIVEAGVPNRWTKSTLYSQSFSAFDPINKQSYYLELFNQGNTPVNYQIASDKAWIQVTKTSGNLDLDEKILVSVDWDQVKEGDQQGELTLSSNGREFKINVPLRRDLPQVSGYVENNGVVSIPADGYKRKVDAKSITWVTVPNMGRTGSSVTVEPANAPVQQASASSPRLDYEFTVLEDGEVSIQTYVSPTLNYKKGDGLKFAIAVDNEAPQVLNINTGEDEPDWEYPEWWNKSVTDHIKQSTSIHQLNKGVHTLKVWMIDPGVVFQQFVIDAGGLKESYLGPTTSTYID